MDSIADAFNNEIISYSIVAFVGTKSLMNNKDEICLISLN